MENLKSRNLVRFSVSYRQNKTGCHWDTFLSALQNLHFQAAEPISTYGQLVKFSHSVYLYLFQPPVTVQLLSQITMSLIMISLIPEELAFTGDPTGD